MDASHAIGFVSAEFALGAARIGVFSLCLGLCASLVPVPFVVSQRIRSLFGAVGPTDSWAGNYVLWVTAVGGGEIAVFALTVDVIAVEYADPAAAERLTVAASAVLVVGYVLALLALLLVVLPRGFDWDDWYDRRAIGLIASGVLWYHAGTVLLSPYAFDWLMGISRLV